MDERDYQAMNKQPKSESRMYSQEEVEKLIASSWYSGARNHFEGRTFITDDNVKDILQSLQPKTEEVGQENEEQKQQRFTVELVKEIEHEFKEQPTSSSIEKMAEEFYIDFGQANMKMTITCGEIRKYRIDAFIEGYKSNNHLEELEKWVKENERKYNISYNNGTHEGCVYTEHLLKKIEELKTKQ